MGAWEDEKKKLGGGVSDWKKQIGGIIAEIKGAPANLRNQPEKKSLGIMKDVVTGGAKMTMGSLGAVPTALGKGLEQIPGVVGKTIGAVPVNPPDLGSNPSAKLAGEGYDQFARGIGGAVSGARKGIMSALDLKESSATPVQAPPVIKKPVSASTPQTLPVQPASANAPPSKEVMQEIKDTRVPGWGIGDEKPPESAGFIENAETGERINVPKSTGETRASDKDDISNMINELKNDPANRVTQNMGINQGIKTGGLKPNVLAQIVELQKARLGLEGQKTTAVESAKERAGAMKERNELLKAQIEERRAAGEDTRELRKQMAEDTVFQKDLTKFGTNDMGEFNPEKGLFEMADQGIHINRPEVQRAYSVYKKMLDDIEKQHKGKATPKQIKDFKERYFKEKGWV